MFSKDIDELGDAFGLYPHLLVVLISEHRHHFLKALHIVVQVLAKAAKGDVFLIDVAFAEAKSLGHTQIEEHIWSHIECQGSQNSSNLSFSCVMQGDSEGKGLSGRNSLYCCIRIWVVSLWQLGGCSLRVDSIQLSSCDT